MGWDGSASLPETLTVKLPRQFARRVRLGTDPARRLGPFLLPANLRCRIGLAVDGLLKVHSFHAEDPFPGTKVWQDNDRSRPAQGYSLEIAGACMGDQRALAAAHDPHACSDLVDFMMSSSFPCGGIPSGESVEWLTGTTMVHDDSRGDFIRFVDPPDVRGSGHPSGNGTEAIGAFFYRRGDPYSTTGKVTCTLASDDRELCDFLIERFVGELRDRVRSVAPGVK